MKKIITSLVIVSALLLISCEKDDNKSQIQITDIQLSEKTDILLNIGEISKNITIQGGNGKDFEVKSEDSSIAKVKQDGNKFTIEASGVGQTTISIKSANKIAKLSVKVNALDIQLSENSPIGLKVGDTKTITIKGGNGKDFEVKSSVENIVKIEKDKDNFTITALKEGKTTITVSSSDKKAELNINVSKKEILIERIDIEALESIQAGTGSSLKVTIFPENASNKELTWESSDKNVILVNDSGQIHAKINPGKSATITVKAKDGSNVSGQITIKVIKLVESINVLNNSGLSLGVGTIFDLNESILITPDDATDKSITWTSDNPEVISVNNKGVITAHKEGKAYITATSNDNSSISNTNEIKAIWGIENITIDKANNNSLSVKKGSKTPLSITTWAEGKVIDRGIQKMSKNGFGKVIWKTNEGHYFSTKKGEEHIFDAYKTGNVQVTATYYNELEEEYIDEIITIIVTN